ncbi:hypothetical protein LTR13_004777 [Exophiala sideris]|uniref:DNA/RNA-binding protein Alba-like domain-containing protein n=1 Tax=Exophiala sideris TaxID=1016849 RepID=A0ABR0J9M0_9EURO|nr:hypothetical protein LTR13_004777 [Exophiala sideris]KAK5059280.1 hypothetical protein LTR69_006570 [Exophiala sideris]KAK5183114.1 hypothetical protein LTR44_004825 [Eurotiomycetes sp. CCFEE 6388]
MSKQGSKSHKKVKRDERSDSDSEDDLQPIHFFVPGEGINAAVLVEYITQYVDRTAKITSSHHPTVRSKSRRCDRADHAQDKTRTGFNVLAKKTLNAVRSLLEYRPSSDTHFHLIEKFRKDPYRYAESDTARRRARQGASKGGTARPARSARETSTEPESYRRDKTASPSQYPGLQPQVGSGYHQGQSRTDYPSSNTYNIYNAVSATSYSANVPTNPSQQAPGTYSYAQVPKTVSDYPPPSYEQAAPRGPPRPQTPSQPGPETFDRKELSRNPSGDVPTSRQGSTSQDDPRRRPETYDEMTRRSSRR